VIVRRLLIVLVAAASFLAMGTVGVVLIPSHAALQETTDDEEEPQPTIERVFQLGEAYPGDGYALTPHSIVSAASPDRPGFSEVRLDVHLLNTGTDPIELADFGLPDISGTVTLFVEDGGGETWPLDLLHPLDGSRPGSEVRALQPGLSARWTLGFEVPTPLVATAKLVLIEAGARVSEWDLATASVGVEFSPPSITTVTIGSSFPWDTEQRVTVTGIGSRVCGDPRIEPVAHIITVTMDVDNAASTEYRWPGLRFPDVPAIAQWSDGSSARVSLDTHVGTDDDLFRYFGGAGALLPPLDTTARAFVMAAPRDGRFVDIAALPAGMWLRPPAAGSEAIWLDLTGVAPSVGIDPALCDLGVLPAPIPYSYGPSPKFTVFGEGPFPDTAAQDLAAQELIRSALAAAGMYFDGHGLTFNSVTAADLSAVAPTITWVGHTAGASLPSTVGTVWFDRRPANRNEFYVITRSASGAWFCSVLDAYTSTTSFSGPTARDTAELCIPALAGDDEA
jgi:hypothetical protein